MYNRGGGVVLYLVDSGSWEKGGIFLWVCKGFEIICMIEVGSCILGKLDSWEKSMVLVLGRSEKI